MRQTIVRIITILTCFFIGVLCTVIVYKLVPQSITEKIIKDITVTESETIKSSIDKVFNSVVYIYSKADRTTTTGTGFVYKTDNDYGYIITNSHVVESADSIEVTNVANINSSAILLGRDEFSDIAVLRVPKDFVVLEAIIGTSTRSFVGDTIFTVGSPLGKDYINTVSKGIISGTNRTITVTQTSGDFLMDVLQIDASINPGNSGGPLCNINGEVIGVNSLKLIDSSVEGMGFAIPIDYVMTMVKKLENGKKIERPYIGAKLLNASEQWKLYRYGIYLDNSIKTGAVFTSFEKGSPFAIAGLQKKDVITRIDDREINSVAEFRYIIYNHSINDEIIISYIRDNKESEIKVNLYKSVNEN